MQALDGRPLILNVEDNDIARSAVSVLLRQEGFDVQEAQSGEEALAQLKRKPDVILLDVNLGYGIDGLEVCRRLRSESATAAIPLILISSQRVSCEDRVQGLEIGADDYLVKPVNPAEMVAHIKALLRVRRAEKAQRESEERFQAIIEKSFDCINLVAADGTILYTSPSSVVISGHTPEETIGRNTFDLLHPDDVPQVREQFERLIRNPGSCETFVHRGRHKDGSWRWLEARGTNLLHEPSVRALVINFRDITEQRLAQEQLRQAQKMEAIGRLAGGVAHDFNNLLCIINGYSDILLQRAAEDSTREMLVEIKKAGELSASLTRQLLAFSRRQVLTPKLLDLNAVIRNIEKMLRRVIGEDVELVTNLSAGLGIIEADPGQIEQVVMNLAVNARDAMPGGGKLTIETSNLLISTGEASAHTDVPAGRYVVLSVQDTGCGMTAEIKARIFEPFFTTKGPGKGTGLGLATIYGIVKQSGGHIEVESEPGNGTRFRIYLPRAATLACPTPSRHEMRLPPQGRETILVVEDEDAVRSLTMLVLRKAGYDVLEACDGAAALQIAENHQGEIDLVVTDVVMPGLGGRLVVEKLLQQRPQMRVLYLSGYTDDAVFRQGVQHHEVNFLPKPFTPAALTEKVREVLDVPNVVETITNTNPCASAANR